MEGFQRQRYASNAANLWVKSQIQNLSCGGTYFSDFPLLPGTKYSKELHCVAAGEARVETQHHVDLGTGGRELNGGMGSTWRKHLAAGLRAIRDRFQGGEPLVKRLVRSLEPLA